MSHTTAIDRSLPDASALSTWGFAGALATLGTATLWKTSIGINFSVWILCAVIALFTVMRDRFGVVSPASLAAGSWAIVLAFGAAITTDGFRLGLLMIATAVLLAIALVMARRESLDALQPVVALLAPFVATALVIGGAIQQAVGTARNARQPGFAAVIRSALITLPLVTALVFLLAEADPTFAAARDGLERVVPDDFIAKSGFFLFLLGLTLGAFGEVSQGDRDDTARAPKGITVGTMERRVLMTALAAIVWIFVGSAGVSLMRNPAAVAGSGITYAEYVHRGFAELSLAATIVIGAVLVTRQSWLASDAWARAAAAAAVVGESGMIAIGFMRVVKYEQAYGFTQQRLYAQAYMIVLACMSGLLLIETLRRARSSHFAYHSASAALLIVAGCVFANTDAWIVRHNIERYRESGQLDAWYITNGMSDDAIPALIDNLNSLRQPELGVVTKFLREKDSDLQKARALKWYSWNLRARAAKSAAHAFHGNDIAGWAPVRRIVTGG